MTRMNAAKVRYIRASSSIRANRTAGFGLSDEEVVRREGYADIKDFWYDAMSHEMGVTTFIRLMEGGLLTPSGFADEVHRRRPPIEGLITHALQEAFENNEPWFFKKRNGGDEFYDMKVRPKEAAEWLLSRPFHNDKVPDSLKAFLQGSPSKNDVALSIVVSNHIAVELKKKGPRPQKFPAVKAALVAALTRGTISRDALQDMTDKELVRQFGVPLSAKRDTCRKARDDALLEFVAN